MSAPCPTCGFVKEHLKPVSKGGTDAPSNYIGVYKGAADQIRPHIDNAKTYRISRLRFGRLFMFFEWRRK